MYITGKDTAELRIPFDFRQKKILTISLLTIRIFVKPVCRQPHDPSPSDRHRVCLLRRYSPPSFLCLSIDARVPYMILSSWALMSALA